MASTHPLAALALARSLLGPGRDTARARPQDDARTSRGTRSVFIAEHYVSDLDSSAIEALAGRLRAAVDESAGAVRFLGAAGLPGDDSFLSIFIAPSLEAVSRLVERAGVDADRVAPALWQAGEG